MDDRLLVATRKGLFTFLRDVNGWQEARREFLAGLSDHVLALLGEHGRGATHFVPDAAERVVGEELDDVARREELVAHSQLVAVARRLALLAHLAALVLPVEELVDPADGLVFAPHAGEFGGVHDLEELLERGALGPEHARGIAPVEENLYFGR